ncbi:hypothetical protein BJY01DRAFT_245067 [Aspergillus pseudoustus]|uniref:DUF7703 domain-containing protein n=1 Tax=Aspergillus pseudoustus TaxID=1810923 RepID=A0ABR4KFZ2_9EURO
MSSAGQQGLHQASSHNDIFVAGLILLGIGAYNAVEVFVLLLRTFRGFFFYCCLIADLSLVGVIASCSAYLFVLIVAVREIVLCAIYMVQAYRELGTISLIKGPAGRRVMCDMIAVQAVVIAFDVAQVGVTLGTPEAIQWGYTCLVYALKLKMEFAALETLRKLLRSPVEPTMQYQNLSPEGRRPTEPANSRDMMHASHLVRDHITIMNVNILATPLSLPRSRDRAVQEQKHDTHPRHSTRDQVIISSVGISTTLLLTTVTLSPNMLPSAKATP